jgi:hypothetical protein
MTNNRITALNRSRYLVLTITAALVAAVSAVFLVGAPPIPAAIGVVIAVTWLVWRAPAA